MKVWQFMEAAEGGPVSWTWRVVGASGNLEAISAEPHQNYGSAVTDAIRHGFLPSSDRWVVITSAGTTRFEPTGTTREHPEVEKPLPPGASTDGKATGY